MIKLWIHRKPRVSKLGSVGSLNNFEGLSSRRDWISYIVQRTGFGNNLEMTLKGKKKAFKRLLFSAHLN